MADVTGGSRRGNGRLRDLLSEGGWTYEALARSVRRIAAENGDDSIHPNRSSIAHWVGGVQPSPRVRGYLIEALSRRLQRRVTTEDLGLAAGEDVAGDLGLTLTKDPAATVGALAHADLGRRSFLGTAAYSALALSGPLGPAAAAAVERGRHTPTGASLRLMGDADVDAVRLITRAFRDVDERLGGEHGRTAVVTYLAQDVVPMCQGRFTRDATRKQMLASAAQLAWLAGWKAHDAGKESLSQRYYLQAFSLAEQGDGAAHSAWMLRSLAHHAMDIGQPDRCVDLAQAAWDRGHRLVDPGTAALLALTLSRAHAYAGNRRSALRWLARGEVISGAADPAPEAPWWSDAQGPTANLLASSSAKTFTALGDHARAEPFIAQAAARWNSRTHPRVHALTLARLGASQAAQGRLESACAAWSQAVGPLAATHSARTRHALDLIGRTLAIPRYRDSNAARALRHDLSGAG